MLPGDLCGLSLRHGTVKWRADGREFCFCCIGCRQVFIILTEAADSPNPLHFKETALFKKCLEMGIIPASESDLEQRPANKPATHPLPAEQIDTEPATDAKDDFQDNTLSLHLNVGDMWCPACAWVIEQALSKHSGVVRASCNFSTDRVYCEYNPVKTSPEQLIQTIGNLGYRATVPEEDGSTSETGKDFIRFAICAFLTANVMMLSFALYSGFFTQLTPETVAKLSWPIFILAGIVFFYGGPKIYRKAWAGFFSGAFGMETLITFGAFSAFIYSTFNLFSGSIHLYYDTACMLITLTLLGKTIERKAKDAVQQDLGNFFCLKPSKVKRCSNQFPGGRYVAAKMLRQGDFFKVQESEIIPADGLVVEGSGTIDESSLTGEALPIQKKTGNRVRSGTRVLQGALKVKAEAVGEASTLGQMIKIMEKALGQKIPLEGKTDRILRWFVPLVLLLAVTTGWACLIAGHSFETAIIRAVTVMVISCPCALGIAIPIARVAGISAAGNKGILVRDFSAFEKAQQTDTIVFDKTGTLTRGEWSLLDIIVMAPFDEKQILAPAAALEQKSDHYIAAAIAKRALQSAVLPAALTEIQCYQNGISGMFGADTIKIGSRSFIAQDETTSLTLSNVNVEDETLQSTVYMSYSSRFCAVFVFGDTLRPTAVDTINKLRDQGYNIALVSGDGEQTTRAVGTMLGIDSAYGGKLPQDKAFFVQDLQQKGNIVTMVGDGVNDAPALIQADLAIAVHSGSRLGKEAADITLMRGTPEQILDYLDLARQVNKKIQQNLLFSLSYNFISIPVAMSGLLTPIVAVCAMLLSSLSVTGNTLLLARKYKSTLIDRKQNGVGGKFGVGPR